MKKTKLLALLLTLSTLIGLFTACGTKPAEQVQTTAVEEVTTAAPVADIVIAENSICDYTVIRADELATDSSVVKSSIALRLAIKEKFGGEPQIKSDWYNDKKESLPDTAKELLIGETNRKESISALKKIRYNDFIICCDGDRIVITGGCEEATVRACNYFTENYIDKQTGSLTIPGDLEYIDRYTYIYKSMAIDGVDISAYTIVYADGTDKYPLYTAQNLADYIRGCVGIELTVQSDKKAESEYEILIGNTNRAASTEAAAKTLAADEFLLCQSGKKIVMLGADYMVAGAAGKLLNTHLAATGTDFAADAKDIPAVADAKPEKQVWSETKNVILMIGDGMGRNHVLATIANGKLSEWSGDKFPAQAYCTTASRSVQLGKKTYTDSAAAATALATGYKTINGYLGLNEYQKKVKSVRELANEKGYKTAILTTDAITGATPAGFLVHINDRDATDTIKEQIDAVVAAGGVQYCAGSLADKLLSNTRDALALISENGSNFFTMIEEAYPDKGSHSNDMTKVMTGVVRLNSAVMYAAAFTMMHPDTALIITADHETGGITLTDGTYVFTQTTHTNTSVPVYGLGAGMTDFLKSGEIDNLDISRFIAKACGESSWGQK